MFGSIPDPSLLRSIVGFQRRTTLGTHIIDLLKESEWLDNSQESVMMEAMKSVDTLGNGVITKAECLVALQKIDDQITMEDVEQIFYVVDQNNDGLLDQGEILIARIYRKITSNEERLIQIFNEIDEDRNGYIEAEELYLALQGVQDTNGDIMTLEKVKEMITEHDIREDGKLDFDEFVKIFVGHDPNYSSNVYRRFRKNSLSPAPSPDTRNKTKEHFKMSPNKRPRNKSLKKKKQIK